MDRLAWDGRSHSLSNPVMGDRETKRFSDEVIVVVKQKACDGMMTYWRITLSVKDKEVGGEGRNILTAERPY
jgi:hypothetical protein